MKKKTVSLVVGLICAGSALPLMAQTPSTTGESASPSSVLQTDAPVGMTKALPKQSGKTESRHSHTQELDHSKMHGMDHSKMQGMEGGMQGMDHSKMQGMEGGMQGMDHSKMPGMEGGMQGMDDSKMPGMEGGMQGMDHSKMPGMEGGMQGMDHSKMPGVEGGMQGMDHSKMPGMEGGMQGMDHSKMPGMEGDMQGMDHSKMPGMEGGMQGMDHSKMPGMEGGMQGMAGMNHGSVPMNMQGGSPPPDARDPDGYSNGYTLDSGPYSLGPDRRLRMADEHSFGSVLVDRLEAVHTSAGRSNSYEAQAWFGNSYNKLVVKSEGEISNGKVEEARNELLWGRAFATYFDTQIGIRNDSGSGKSGRNWLAFGIQGIAPYWFEVEATGYISQNGRTAVRLAAEYELLLTQRLILQPRLEANFYGKNDARVEVGSGLSNATTGLRLRYEFSRQFAPYVGIERYSTFGNTADMVRAAAGRVNETRVVAGVRMWF